MTDHSMMQNDSKNKTYKMTTKGQLKQSMQQDNKNLNNDNKSKIGKRWPKQNKNDRMTTKQSMQINKLKILLTLQN